MNPSEPAFPQHGWTTNPEVLERMKNQGGLTKREYFAGQALANEALGRAYHNQSGFLAAHCVEYADALIAELAKPKPQPAAPAHRSCPVCGFDLEPVTYPGGYLNPDQWESVRAGDWFCDSCKPRRYFFERDGKLVASETK
jgi:hypothetical protein